MSLPQIGIPRQRPPDRRVHELRKALMRDARGKASGPLAVALDIVAEMESAQ
jgi:hypothetical protein